MGIAHAGRIGVKTARNIWRHPENRGRRLQRTALWVWWQVWQRTMQRPWKVRLHEATLLAHPHDHVSSLAIYYGLYDAEEMRFLLAWLEDGDSFVDVGANVAPYSLLATTISGVRATAFEPGDLATQRARENIELNGVADRLTLVASAVGDEDGTARMTTDLWATNHLVSGDETAASVEVPVIRLDSYDEAHDLGDVALIKIDVEGHEVLVLRGAKRLLDVHRPALIVEINDPVDDLQRALSALGYVPVSFDPASGKLVERPFPTTPGGNLIAVADLPAAQRRLARAI